MHYTLTCPTSIEMMKVKFRGNSIKLRWYLFLYRENGVLALGQAIIFTYMTITVMPVVFTSRPDAKQMVIIGFPMFSISNYTIPPILTCHCVHHKMPQQLAMNVGIPIWKYTAHSSSIATVSHYVHSLPHNVQYYQNQVKNTQ